MIGSSDAATRTARSFDEWLGRVPCWKLAISLGVGGLLVHLVFSFAVFPIISGPLRLGVDPDGFGGLAQNIVDGVGFRFDYGTGELTTYRAPAFPFLLAGGLALTGNLVSTAVITQAIIGALTVVSVFWLGDIAFSKRVGFGAALIAAIHPMLVWWSPRMRYEPLLALMVVLMVLTGVRLLRAPTIQRSLAFGAAVGVATLTAQIVVPLAVALVAAMVAMSRARRIMTARVAVSLLVAALLVLPWTARNYEVTDGHIVLVQTGGVMEFVRGIYFVEAYPAAPLRVTVVDRTANEMITEDFGDELGEDWYRGDRHVEDVLGPYAAEYLTESPGAFIAGFLEQLPRFWYLSESPAKSLFILGIQFPLMMLAAVGTVVMLRRREWTVVLIALPVVYFNVVYSLFHAKARFSVPAVPFLIILAVVGVRMLVSFHRGARVPSEPVKS